MTTPVDPLLAVIDHDPYLRLKKEGLSTRAVNVVLDLCEKQQSVTHRHRIPGSWEYLETVTFLPRLYPRRDDIRDAIASGALDLKRVRNVGKLTELEIKEWCGVIKKINRCPTCHQPIKP